MFARDDTHKMQWAFFSRPKLQSILLHLSHIVHRRLIDFDRVELGGGINDIGVFDDAERINNKSSNISFSFAGGRWTCLELSRCLLGFAGWSTSRPRFRRLRVGCSRAGESWGGSVWISKLSISSRTRFLRSSMSVRIFSFKTCSSF